MNMRMMFVAIAAVVLVGCGSEEKFASEVELPKLDALVFKSEGSTIYGQVLVPSAKFAGPRPSLRGQDPASSSAMDSPALRAGTMSHTTFAALG